MLIFFYASYKYEKNAFFCLVCVSDCKRKKKISQKMSQKMSAQK